MKPPSRYRHLLELNLAILFISTSGVLGRVITFAPPISIWGRALIGFLCVAAYCVYRKIPMRLASKKDAGVLVLSGLLFGGHWITYFYSLQWSNVAIAMIAIFTYPVMTAFMEPLISRAKFQWAHVLLGMLVLVGMYFLTPEMNIENKQTKGMLFGVLSAFLYAIRNIISKQQVEKYSGSFIMLLQTLVVALVLLPVLWVYPLEGSSINWFYIFLLGLLTTAIGHTLYVNGLRNFSATSAGIVSGLQPIFAIILAIIFLGEIPNARTLIGGALILCTVLIESRRTLKKS